MRFGFRAIRQSGAKFVSYRGELAEIFVFRKPGPQPLAVVDKLPACDLEFRSGPVDLLVVAGLQTREGVQNGSRALMISGDWNGSDDVTTEEHIRRTERVLNETKSKPVGFPSSHSVVRET